MNRRVRRGLVMLAVAVSLVGGAMSIRVAAELAEAAAPPPAPPVSMSSLKAQLQAEQERAASLQQQLDELLGVTGELTAALDATEARVDVDGSTAAQLRERLKAAEARLAKVTRLLKKAAARLAKLGVAGPTVPPTKHPASGGGGASTTEGTPKPTAKPTPEPAAFELSLDRSGNRVTATWTVCSVSNFHAYALVRSRDAEIHYPPEDLDTVVASESSQASTSAVDDPAPSGKSWYRVYCLSRSGGETKVRATTKTVSVTVP